MNAVAPGPIATELFRNGKTENQIAEFTKMSPLERIGQPGDIANVLSFLAGRTVVGSTPKCYARTASLPTEARKVQ